MGREQKAKIAKNNGEWQMDRLTRERLALVDSKARLAERRCRYWQARAERPYRKALLRRALFLRLFWLGLDVLALVAGGWLAVRI
jgi:hypothetical protein